jgi:uncharacterized protein
VSYYKPRKFIDFHAHVFPDDVAQKAMDMFRKVSPSPVCGDGTASGTSAWMERAGIDLCVAQPVATRPAMVPSMNDWAFSIRSERITSFGGMHPEYADPKSEIDRLLDMGFRGIKLQPGWQEFYPDEERVFPIYAAAEGRLAILFHSGHELNKALEPKGVVRCFRTVHDKFPNLTMIIAHMGGYQQWDEVEHHLVGTGVYLDTSYCPPEELPDERLIQMIRQHGVERILFASDFPLRDPAEDAKRLANMDLTPEEKDAIAWRNGARLLGLPSEG